MTTNQVRAKYLKFFEQRGHGVIPRAGLVPDNDPTTLFTGSGMQPLLPYLLGEQHPAGTRLVDSQTCFRAEDIDEVGDNRHTTFFEMLGNWSLGDYFKQDQLEWFWQFLTDEVGLDATKLYVTCYSGDAKLKIPKDEEAAEIWQGLFKQKGIEAKIAELKNESEAYKIGMQPGERIFYYQDKNWWSRAGQPANMPAGEPGGPDSEVFYEFTEIKHDAKFGKHCHPNCDCGRFLEIGNSVFMQYIKNAKGGFDELPKKNVDFGGGLERIVAASINSPDVFKIDAIWPIIEKLEQKTGKQYTEHVEPMRVIADHMRSAVFMAADGVVPSNKTQGYILRRLLRRAIRHGLELDIEHGLLESVAETVLDIYKEPYPELQKNKDNVISVLEREEKAFRQTIKSGIREERKIANIPKQGWVKVGEEKTTVYEKIPTATIPLIEGNNPNQWEKYSGTFLSGKDIFKLFDTYGFPPELSIEEAARENILIACDWEHNYKREMIKQKDRSRTATKGMFKGGLAEHSEQTVKYHTATHMMYRALRTVLGDHIEQRGSNITGERLRFDFNHPAKVTPEEQKQVEDIVNKAIKDDLPVTWAEMPTEEALATGARGHFGEKYGDTVKVYTIGDPKQPYTMELCGGPHVEHTGQLGEGGKKFKIIKEEANAAGIRRIKAVLQ